MPIASLRSRGRGPFSLVYRPDNVLGAAVHAISAGLQNPREENGNLEYRREYPFPALLDLVCTETADALHSTGSRREHTCKMA